MKSRSDNATTIGQYRLSRPSGIATRLIVGIAVMTMLALVGCSDNGSSVGPNDGGGTTGNTGGGTATGGGATGNTGADELPVLNAASGDDFSVDSLDQWSLRHQIEGTDAQYTVLDINQTTAGALTLQPTLTPGWFAGSDAPLIYRLISGNFAVETGLTVSSANDPTLPPQSEFNSAGLMARNPAGASGPENYVMVNIGRQNSTIANGLGTEHKSTTNSNSVLALQAGSTSGRLLLCRIGDQFSSYRFLDNETGWTLIQTDERPDLPEVLQVGMVANGFSGPDLIATFDYIQLGVPANAAQCLP